MNECPICPDLIALSGKQNSHLHLGKARTEIQHNYNRMFRHIQRNRQQLETFKTKNEESELFPSRQSSPRISVLSSPQRPTYHNSSDSETREHSPIAMSGRTMPNSTQISSPTPTCIPEIREQLMRNEQHRRGQKYNKAYIAFCASIFILSASAYYITSQVLRLPSSRTVERYISQEKNRIGTMFRDFNQMKKLIEHYRDQDSLSQNETTQAVIAVDALFFDRQIVIKSDGTVEGILTPKDATKFDTFHNSLAEFDDFVYENWNASINSAFVYCNSHFCSNGNYCRNND